MTELAVVDSTWMAAGKVPRRGRVSPATNALVRDMVKAVEALGVEVGFIYNGDFQHFYVRRQ